MKRKIAALLMVAMAVGVMVYFAKNKPAPKKVVLQDERVVRVMPAVLKDVNVSIKSFGTVSSAEELTFRSFVAAEVVYKHPSLQDGVFFKKGELLFSLDEREYILALENLKAQIAQANAQRQELQQELKNNKTLANIEKERLVLDKIELEKHKALKDSISDTRLSTFKERYLARKNAYENIQVKLQTLPFKIEAQMATIKALKAQKEIEQIALERCKIYMPFDGVVYDIQTEKHGFINKGELLFKAYNSAKMQIELELASLEFGSLDSKAQNIRATLYSDALQKEIKAHFSHVVKRVDEKTRTLKLVFALNESLSKGMFLEASIVTKEFKNVFTIAQSMYHNQYVYVEKEGLLELRPVSIIGESEGEYIIKGLRENERIVTTSLPGAIAGMRLKVLP